MKYFTPSGIPITHDVVKAINLKLKSIDSTAPAVTRARFAEPDGDELLQTIAKLQVEASPEPEPEQEQDFTAEANELVELATASGLRFTHQPEWRTGVWAGYDRDNGTVVIFGEPPAEYLGQAIVHEIIHHLQHIAANGRELYIEEFIMQDMLPMTTIPQEIADTYGADSCDLWIEAQAWAYQARPDLVLAAWKQYAA